MDNHLFCFGLGYSAEALAKRLLARGWHISGTTRSEERRARLEAMGIKAMIWPTGDAKARIAESLARSSHILISTAPNEQGDPVLHTEHDILSKSARQIKWLGYLSTTGVYGDHKGKWVDEATPACPTTARGQMRVQAEKDWEAFGQRLGIGVHIFRLAGIYGPKRGPFAKIRAGKARLIIKKGQVFSRIHVDDIATILEASIARPHPDGRVYNVCDDSPAPPQDVIAYAAALLGLPVPARVDFETAELGEMARSFYAESKRVQNRRVKAELGVTLAFPDYQTGLRAILDAEGAEK